jgi:tetratricopeptide (TPR) repeat protein/O-antigen ligase
MRPVPRSSRSRSSPPRASTVGAALLAALLVALPLLKGGVGPRTELAAAALALLALLLAARGTGRAPWAGAVLLLPLGVALLQVVPLAGGRFVSLDPPASGRALATLVTGWAGLVAAWHLGAGKRRRDLALHGLAGAGLAVAGGALGLALAGLQPLLAPTFPFPNSNQQGGFAALTALVILGLALRARGQARLVWLLGFALVAAEVFLSLSRGAIAAFLGGAGLFILLAAWREPRPGEQAHRARRALAAGLVLALGVAAYLALDAVISELRTVRLLDDAEKLVLWRPGLQLLRDHPLLGIGRGAFETAFAAYKTGTEAVTYTHLENDWLQPLIDFGVPAGLLVVATFAWLWLRAAWRRELSWPEVGLLAGTAAMAAQGLVDFSLERPAAALAFSVALGLLQRGERAFPLGFRPVAVTAGGLGLATVAGMWLWQAHPLEEVAASVAQAPSAALAEARGRELSRWHPADWLPPATVGARWVEEGRCAPAMPWLLQAMRLGPTAPEPHLYAARCLAASGQDAFARREYRLAHLYGSAEALGEAARRWTSVEDLLQVAPQSADGLLALAGVLRGQDRRADATGLLRRVLDEYREARALVPLAAAALEAGDPEEGLALARRRETEAPLDPEGWRLAALALDKLGRGEEAGAELEKGLARLPGSPPLVATQVSRALAVGRHSEAKRLAEGMAARTPAELAQRQAYVAAALAAQGRLSEAIERARSAVAALPDDAGPLLTLSAYCEQAGRYDDAIAALEHAASLPGQDPALISGRLEGLKKAQAEASTRRRTEQLLQGR